MLPDRWNPRLWLRDWLNAPSHGERAFKAAFREALSEFHRKQDEIDAASKPSGQEASDS